MFPDVDAESVDRVLSDAASRHEFSGTIQLSRGGRVLHQGAYGLASRRWKVPVSLGTRFDVASITKLFTSVAVLQQVDAGTLALDSRIGRFVELEGTRIDPSVTIGQLLTHTSGIGDDADEEAGESYEDLWVDKPTYSVTKTAEFLPQFVHKAPNFSPGTGCRYCNCGYILAGLALEAVTGTSYRDYVREHVFGAAGMQDSGFFSMRDAVRDGKLLSAESTAAFLSPQVRHSDLDAGELHYGYGLEFRLGPTGGVRSLYKDGINAGVSAFLGHYPPADVTLALVSNSEDGAWGPLKKITALLQAG